MFENPSQTPLLNWLIQQFEGEEHAPPRRSLRELSDVAERIVPLYLGRHQPLGEQGMSQVLIASEANRSPEAPESIEIIARLQELAVWSARAAETAQLMKLSALDHKGGRTPNRLLRSIVTILLDRYEFLLGIKASHVCDRETGWGHSTFDQFVQNAIKFYAPEGAYPSFDQIDQAIEWARKQ